MSDDQTKAAERLVEIANWQNAKLKAMLEERDGLRDYCDLSFGYLKIHAEAVKELALVASGAAALLEERGQDNEAEAVRQELQAALDRLNAGLGVDQTRH